MFKMQNRGVITGTLKSISRGGVVLIPLILLSGQTLPAGEEIKISVTGTQPMGTRPAVYIGGYARSVGGQTIDYHSSHPDAESALLVRARRDAPFIRWETDTLRGEGGEYYDLIWLAGIEKEGWAFSKDEHTFDFMINGERWFTFRNLKDPGASTWKIPGKEGSELSFESVTTDRFGDLFGYMRLKVPKRLFNKGTVLTLEVTGEDADAPDWYMTFCYRFNFTPRVSVEPVLLKEKEGVYQMLRMSYDNLEEGKSIEIAVPGSAPVGKKLEIGANIIYVPIRQVLSPAEIPALFTPDNESVSSWRIKVAPAAIREIYIVPYSHNDIGYTDLQPNIEKKQIENIYNALRLIKSTSGFPAEARFRWNLEVIWALESFMKTAPEEKKNEFIDAVKEGKIGLNALYANFLTGLAGSAEMSHFTEYALKFSRDHSVPITTACVSDIPGFTWGLAATLAQSGVKYFSIAPNAGDRVGNIYEMGDRPFYWASQSGEERVLTWIAGTGYSAFHEGDAAKLGDEKIIKLARKLEEFKYPYDIVLLPYTIGGDNGPPDSALPGFVSRWNDRYASPRLIIATHEEVFRRFEKRYGGTLPVLKGDLTPYWEDGAASSARETALNRRAADRLIQGEKVWSMLAPEAFPAEDYYRAWRSVLLYDEHTWGAHNSVTDPDSDFVTGQWEIKKGFALAADSLSALLLARAFETSSAGNEKNVFTLFNTNSWTMSDVVFVPPGESSPGGLIVDEKGREVLSQELSTGELAFLAEKIPPHSSRKFYLKEGKKLLNGSARAYGNTIENEILEGVIDSSRGTIKSLIWKNGGRELAGEGAGLNEYIYVPGKDPDSAQKLTNVTVRIKEAGGLLASIIVSGEAHGCRGFSAEYRIAHGLGRVEIINTIDKKGVREKEGLHFGFNFGIPSGRLRYDVAWGIVNPEEDQLPGSCKNFFSTASFADISNDGFGATLTSADASLIESGSIDAEAPWKKNIRRSPKIYSYVMNNYWHTNYKADQEGIAVFRYSIVPHGLFRHQDALRAGLERRQPLILTTGRIDKTGGSPLFTVEPEAMIATSCRPVGAGSVWLVQLYNPADQKQSVKIKWNPLIPVNVVMSDITGEASGADAGEIEIPPYGIRYLRINRK